MVSEEQILLYYLKIFSFFLIITTLLSIKLIFFDKFSVQNNLIIIEKNEKISSIIKNNLKSSNSFEKIFYTNLLKIYNALYKHVHYGHFEIIENYSFYNLINLITESSKILNKITIVEGWNSYQFKNLLSKIFNDYEVLKYNEIIADTYYINPNSDFLEFKELVKKHKKKLYQIYENHYLLNKFSFEEIIIIGSLIEKEGLDYTDKRKISSVILNRINKKMKLQIDASVIYSITKGKHKFERQLNKNDLKIKDEYNTYFVDFLPPGPISYVGTKTIELIFEDYKSEYLYYFYDKYKKIHIYSKSYKEHTKKLNEYRKKHK